MGRPFSHRFLRGVLWTKSCSHAGESLVLGGPGRPRGLRWASLGATFRSCYPDERPGGIALSCRRELHFGDPVGSQGPPLRTPRPGSRVIRSLYSFLPNRALVQARAPFWGVQGVPGISPGHPFGPPGAHPRSAGRLEGLLGAPGSSRGALWGALGSPGGPIWGSSPPCRRLFLATICYTFTASAPEGIFAAPEGHAIL